MALVSLLPHRLAYGVRRAARKAALAIGLVLAMPASAAPVSIAALGDSLTHGYGLPQEDGFVPQLETWLRERGHDVRVINAGVSGDTTAGGLSRIGWTLTPEVGGLIVALGANDLLRGIDPANSRSNLRGILEAARSTDVPVLLIGLEAPGNYGPDYKQAFDSIYPDLAEEFGAILAPSFFVGFDEENDPAAVRDFMQPDGLHPNAEGVARIVEGLGPYVEELLAEAE